MRPQSAPLYLPRLPYLEAKGQEVEVKQKFIQKAFLFFSCSSPFVKRKARPPFYSSIHWALTLTPSKCRQRALV